MSNIPSALSMINSQHLVADLYHCTAQHYLQHIEPLRTLCIEAVQQHGLHMVGERFHQFEPQGVTGVILLAESHFAIHTWPELGFVSLDVYVCNAHQDHRQQAYHLVQQISALLGSQSPKIQCLTRGKLK